MSFVSFFGMLAAIAVLILLIYKGFHALPVAIVSSLVVILTSGLDIWGSLVNGPNGSWAATMVAFIQNNLLMFIFGATLGEIMGKSQYGFSIALKLMDWFGTKRAVLIVVLAATILSYGGVSMFVIVFAVYPIAVVVFKEANITKHLLPGCVVAGAGTYVMTCLPGSPAVTNVIPTNYLGTTIYAAPVLGLICGIVMFTVNFLYLSGQEKKYREKGESFEPGANEVIPEINDETRKNAPSFIIAICPVLIIFVLNLVLVRTGVNSTYSVCISMCAAILFIVATSFTKLKSSLQEAINKGATNSINAIMNTCTVVGFGGVIKLAPAFKIVTNFALNLPFAPIISATLATAIIAGITTSSSGGLTMFLEMMGADFLAKGVNPQVLHRLSAIAAGTLDSLPHSGPNITLCLVIGTTMKKAYKHIGFVSVVAPTVTVIVGIILATLGVC